MAVAPDDTTDSNGARRPPPGADVAHWAGVIADRLRRLEADFAALAPDVCRQYAAEEVQRGMRAVSAEALPEFLRELGRQLPGVALPGVAAGSVARAKAGQSTEPQAAFAGSYDGGLALDDAAVRAALEMAPEAQLDPARVAELAPHLLGFAATLSQLTWSAWRTIAAQSAIRRGVNLQKFLARCVAGDPEVTPAMAAAELDRLRQLIAALVWAISEVGQQFAAGHLAGLAPAGIEAAVAAESSGSFWTAKGKESAYWRKFCELAESLDPAAVEAAIRDLVVTHAEQVLKTLPKTERR